LVSVGECRGEMTYLSGHTLDVGFNTVSESLRDFIGGHARISDVMISYVPSTEDIQLLAFYTRRDLDLDDEPVKNRILGLFRAPQFS